MCSITKIRFVSVCAYIGRNSAVLFQQLLYMYYIFLFCFGLLHLDLERIQMIEHGASTEKFVDTRGPIILSTIFILYLIVTFFVKL